MRPALNTSFLMSHVGFLTWDVCQNNMVGDEVFAEVYGIELSAAATGVTIEEILARIAPLDRERVAREIHDAILSGLPTATSFRVLSNYQPRLVTFVGRCLQGSDGIPTFFTGAIFHEEHRWANRLRASIWPIGKRQASDGG